MHHQHCFRSLSGRIVSVVWWLFALFLLIFYTANLTAFFTMQRIATHVNSAEDLVAQSDIEYGTVRDGSIWKFFQVCKILSLGVIRVTMLGI